MTLDRRGFLNACTRAGIASPLMPGILYALAVQAQEPAPGAQTSPAASSAPSEAASPSTGSEAKPPELPKITPEMIDRAAELAGVGPFTGEQKKVMLDGLNEQREAYAQIRALKLTNNVQPAFVFHPQPAAKPAESRVAYTAAAPQLLFDDSVTGEPTAPANIEDLAFANVLELANLIYHRKVTSLALTQMYIARLKRYDPALHFVITLTEERALAQARAADDDLDAGLYHGPLHGIPWGAKDLLAVKGYPTTWGAGGFEHQAFKEDATVVERLDAAGAVLVAKFTLGALAMGDKWFGDKRATRGIRRRVRAGLRRGRRARWPPAAWASRSGRRRWDRSRRLPRAAGQRD